MSDRNASLYLDDAEAEGRRPRARAAARKDEYREDVEHGRLIFDDEPSASKPPGATMTEEELTQIRAEHERLEGYMHGFFGRDLSEFRQR